jgi:Zn-dependent protease
MMMFFSMILALTGFTFLAPGAVMILGRYISKKQNGIISVAGPLTNLILAGIFYLLNIYAFSVGNNFLFLLSMIGVQVNAFLGIFNMLPFWILDGRKVFAWNKVVYFLVLIPLILFFVGIVY